MKKRLTYLLPLLVFMVAGAALRWWQLETAFEPDTGLLTPGMPATVALIALMVVAAAWLFWAARRLAGPVAFRGYLSAFALPKSWVGAVYVLAGALLLAAGALLLRDTEAWRTGGEPAFRLGRLVLGVALLPTGVSVGAVGWLNGQREEAKGRFAWVLMAPGYCACLWLIAAYQSHASEPNVMAYALYFLGVIAGACCCYLMAAFSFEGPRGTACLWTGGMALVLLTTAGVDFLRGGTRGELLITLGYMLYLLAQLKCLLTRCQVPPALEPWTPEDGEDDETEVTDHV